LECSIRDRLNRALMFRSKTLVILLLTFSAEFSRDKASEMELVRIDQDKKHFEFKDSNAPFTPWGFNYDHDSSGRLLETYWIEEWDSVIGDFQEMKALGANTVRIHLQVGSFMNSESELNQSSLKQLVQLLTLARRVGLYLDITGLGCYDKKAVPSWYNELSEKARWDVQSRFWEAIARVCTASPAVFCYDLMNEPVVTEDKKERDWTPSAFGDRYFVQRITVDFKGRSEQEIAKTWINKLANAIRKHDPNHLITIGAIPWALKSANAKPLFYSREVSTNLDFVSLHFYPKTSELEKALKALTVYNIGKPIIIEETFPLSCSIPDLEKFIDRSKSIASGWLGFYWGRPISDYKKTNRTIAEDLTLKWLEFFERKTVQILPSE
jgi:hypothetical protein